MAQPAKGKEPASDSIMTAGDMKPLLALSKREPVHAAIGITADGDGVILLNKKMKPKKVLAMLKADASKAKIQLQPSTLRFGKAEVDTEYDPGMVRFFINKEAPGNMRVKLLEVVKRVPYQKVELNVDPSLEEESEDDETEAQDTATSTTTAAPPPAPPPTAPPMDPAVAEAALRRALAGLIARIPATAGDDAARKATLLKVAGIANDELKAHKLEEAGVTITRLRQVLDASPTPGTGGPHADPARWKAARAAWQDASETVDGQIAVLQQKLRESGDDELEEIAEYGLNGVTAGHKVPLMAIMMEIGAGTPESLAKNGAKALGLVQAFRKHIESDERVAACDENPDGVPVTIRATLGPALAGLEAALAPA